MDLPPARRRVLADIEAFRWWADVDVETFASWLKITPQELRKYEAGDPAPEELVERARRWGENKCWADMYGQEFDPSTGDRSI